VRLQAAARGRAARRKVAARRAEAAAAAAAQEAGAAVRLQSAARRRAARRRAAEQRAAIAARARGAVRIQQAFRARRRVRVEEADAAAAVAAALGGALQEVAARVEADRAEAQEAEEAAAVEAALGGALEEVAARVEADRAEAQEAEEAAAVAAAVQEEIARVEAQEAEAAAVTALSRGKWWWGWCQQLLLVAMVVAAGSWWVLQGPLSVPCGRASLASGEGPVTVGQCLESEGGSRYLGWVPGMKWKARLTVTGDGAQYSGSDGQEVPFSAVLGEKKNGDGSGQGGGMLCSAERMVRRAVPFVGTAEHRARMRGESLVVGGGIFCHTHATPRPPPKSVLDALFRGRGSGIAMFSEHTGDLQVVNSRGEVVWSVGDNTSSSSTSTSASGSNPAEGRARWWRRGWGKKKKRDGSEKTGGWG
ncbi:unnamed protein product, partial [Ectocarpus fasciculatus]